MGPARLVNSIETDKGKPTGLMMGITGMMKKTNQAIRDGLSYGDTAYRDEDGFTGMWAGQ